MNRWTGTGQLAQDPKLLETDNGTADCTLRIAVKRAGRQGQDGYSTSSASTPRRTPASAT